MKIKRKHETAGVDSRVSDVVLCEKIRFDVPTPFYLSDAISIERARARARAQHVFDDNSIAPTEGRED